MTIYFIADLHLDASRPAVTRAFFTWLNDVAAGAGALYILGDLFEIWIGDDDDSPFIRDVIERLRSFADAGIPLYLMRGNRDFLLGGRFADRAGATLLPDPTTIDLGGERVLLMHGDSLCTRDADYMAFRRQVRARDWRERLLARPLAERREIAAQLRERSRSMNSLKAADIMDVTPEEVVREMEAHRVQKLIHGHTHRPARHSLRANGHGAERLVLGDWGVKGWCLAVPDAGGWRLESWDVTQG